MCVCVWLGGWVGGCVCVWVGVGVCVCAHIISAKQPLNIIRSEEMCYERLRLRERNKTARQRSTDRNVEVGEGPPRPWGVQKRHE